MTSLSMSQQQCSTFDEATRREWLVTDGLGGYAMGTVAGVETRRYHGLLVHATAPPIGRMMGLVALDAVVVIGDARVRLAEHEWAGGAIEPRGHELLASFELRDGVPRWRWQIGSLEIEREIAMAHGRNAVGITYRVVRSLDPVRIEITPLCTWRDAHGERFAFGEPRSEATADGFVFEDAYRVRGPGYRPGGAWYRALAHREESARGLNATEDVWANGTFAVSLDAGAETSIEAWTAPLDAPPPAAGVLVRSARQRARSWARRCQPDDRIDRILAHAADQMIVSGPTVVAGYPWFGDWSRDTMTSYEGLFLETGRAEEGRALLRRAAESISEGMLANTADAGGTEYNTVDAAMWYLHAVGRHIARTDDRDLEAELAGPLSTIVDAHLKGTRFGIRVDDDGLITQGADGWALTWMDARVAGVPVTARRGKPVEVNALWIEGLSVVTGALERAGQDRSRIDRLGLAARTSFARFGRPGGLADVLDEAHTRPNQLIAAALVDDVDASAVWRAVQPLITPLGVRSLAPSDPDYLGRHRGSGAERDRAYHQGTVWPWLIGPLVDVARRAGVGHLIDLSALEGHLGDWGLGSVSETADGDPPYGATGCPFQAWSVAELLRARRALRAAPVRRPAR